MWLAVAGSALADARAPGQRPVSATAEAGFWAEFDKAEDHVKGAGDLNRDPALNAYVRGVACRVAAEYCDDLRVYVLDRPFFNASMAPNGYSEVYSGLLLRCENEAELAFVLGHEVAHFVENHTLEAHEADKARANFALALSVGVAVAGAAAAANAPTYDSAQSIVNATGDLIDVVYLARVAGYFRFSRAHEQEADRLGLERQVRAGYAGASAAQTWRYLTDEVQASDFDRVRRSAARTSIYATHPLAADRIEALSTKAAESPPGGELGADRYRAAIRPFLGAWLRDDLRRKDYGQTLHILDRLGRSGEDAGVVAFYRGEVYRLRRGEGDLDRARDAYVAATQHADAPAAAWRELGDILSRNRDHAGARRAYTAYLAKAPDADDAWLVEDSLKSLPEGEGA